MASQSKEMTVAKEPPRQSTDRMSLLRRIMLMIFYHKRIQRMKDIRYRNLTIFRTLMTIQ